MSHGKHYFIGQTHEDNDIAKAEGGETHGPTFRTQQEAITYALSQKPADHPDVERVRNRESGGRDRWRSTR